MKYSGRKFIDKTFRYVVFLLAGLACVPLMLILFKLIAEGWHQINPDFFTKNVPTSLDAMLALGNRKPIPGGIANGITGTLLMTGLASLIAIPAGVFSGIYLHEHRHTLVSGWIRFGAEILQGVPSVLIGVIVYIWLVVPLKSYSLMAGGAALAVMMLPMIVRSTEESLNLIPSGLKEAASALGASYGASLFKVVLPASFGGILTGILLTISRVMGETAPLMLTALGAAYVELDITKPASAVPLLIWEFYNDPNLQGMIWSASLFLLVLVLVFNLCAKHIKSKWKI